MWLGLQLFSYFHIIFTPLDFYVQVHPCTNLVLAFTQILDEYGISDKVHMLALYVFSMNPECHCHSASGSHAAMCLTMPKMSKMSWPGGMQSAPPILIYQGWLWTT